MASIVHIIVDSHRTGVAELAIAVGAFIVNILASKLIAVSDLGQVNNSIVDIISNFVHDIFHCNRAIDNVQQHSIHIVLGIVNGTIRIVTTIPGIQLFDLPLSINVALIHNLGAQSVVQVIHRNIQSSELSAEPLVNIVRNTTASLNILQEVVADSSVTNIAASIVQGVVQISVIAQSDGRFGMSRQLALEHSRIASSNRLLGLIGLLGLIAGSSAASQHGDSHDTGQHQRSNLLEFHSEFFLLMVYKR